MIDNTERKPAAVARRMETEASEATARTKSQFLVNLCHELRAPVIGIHGMLELALEMPGTVLGDQVRLRQVLINLIGNAFKFTSKGKVVVRLGVGRATSKAFSQVDAPDRRRPDGKGLGFAISREIVKPMGGTISFESEEGLGSTKSTETTSPAPAGEGIRRLLLAEDDAITRQVLGQMLKRANYKVDFAADGLEAVEMWEKGAYDLVLMDVQMPRSNGFEATRAIREKERGLLCHTPIVAMTAHARKEECHAGGMDAYISKPIDFKKTLKVIENIFNQQSR